MANRLKKILNPILKEECNKAFQRGFEEGKQAGWDKRVLSYENEIECLKNVIESLRQAPVERFLFQDGKIIPLNRLEWISVKDRLPEYFGSFIVAVFENDTDNTTYADSALFDPFEKSWRTDGYFARGCEVTHWMPLPQPPKGE